MSSNLINYKETVDYLYGLQKHGIKLGLKNTEKLMHALGEPHKSFRSVHIAGTNGKGSTASMIAAILRRNGFRVGLYTSPHLVGFTERIRINNSLIEESDVIRLTSYIRKVIGGMDINPTFFEFVTAMAFYYFKREKTDWAVVETGMGGRLDATNVITPEVSVITNIGLDHTEFLGHTVCDIAREKAGIIKPSAPLVTAAADPEVLAILKETAKDAGCDVHIYGEDFTGIPVCMDDKHIDFYYNDLSFSASRDHEKGRRFSIPLTGKYQVHNACTAIKASYILSSKGFIITEDIIRDGLLNLDVQGRLETISEKPLIVIDSAHNPGAALSLADAVRDVFPAKKIITVAGIMKDKDTTGVLKPLLEISDTLILTRPKGERAAATERLKEDINTIIESNQNYNASVLRRNNDFKILTTHTVSEAVALAKSLYREGSIILVTGSFYTTGEAKEILCHPAGVFPQLRE